MSWHRSGRIATSDLLGFLPPLFRAVDVKKLHPYPAIWLNRAVKQKKIKRIIKGFYVNTFKCELSGHWPTLEEIGCFIRSPSYVSREWALSYHGVLGQFPHACTMVTLAASVGLRHEVRVDEFTLEYSKIKKSLFWGFELRDGFLLASPEKALLDAIYLSGYIPFADELDTDFLDMERLLESADQFPAKVQSVAKEMTRNN